MPPATDYRSPFPFEREYQPSPSAASTPASIATSQDPSTPGTRTPTGPSNLAFTTFPASNDTAIEESEPRNIGKETTWTGSSSSARARLGSESSDYASYRIACLEARLEDDVDDDGKPLSEAQRENIRLAIDMYARGEGLPKWDGLVYIQDGRVVEGDEVQREREYWFEVSTVLGILVWVDEVED